MVRGAEKGEWEVAKFEIGQVGRPQAVMSQAAPSQECGLHGGDTAGK